MGTIITAVRTFLFEDSLSDYGWAAALYDPTTKTIVAEGDDHHSCWLGLGVDGRDDDNSFEIRQQKTKLGYIEGFSYEGNFYTREEALIEWRKRHSKVVKDTCYRTRKDRDWGDSSDLYDSIRYPVV